MPVIALVLVGIAVCGVNGTAFVEGALCIGFLIWLLALVGGSAKESSGF